MRLIDAERFDVVCDKVPDGMDMDSYVAGQQKILNMIYEAPTAELSTFHVIDRKTGKEADCYDIALHEEWAKGLCYCDMEGFAIGGDGTLWLMDECGKMAYADGERFEVVWDDPEEETECD